MVEKILRCYGEKISLIRADTATAVYGFVQPVTGRGQNMSRITVTAAGAGGDGQYVYIGPVDPEAAAGDELEVRGKRYILRRAEQVTGTGGPAYVWGMCVEKGGEDAWGLNG